MKLLSENGKAQLASKRADTWYQLTVAGNVFYRSHIMSYQFECPRGDNAATASVTIQNDRGRYSEFFAVGQSLQIEEGLVVQGTVENFGGFYGLIIAVNPSQRGASTITLKAIDYVGRLKDLDVDTQIESPKTDVVNETPTPTYFAAPNDNLAQVFTLANEGLATTPPVIVRVRDRRTENRFTQQSGFEVDYENGILVFGNPINMDEFNVIVDYSFYDSATAFYVEDVIESIITAVDGYGNTPFSTAANLRDTLDNVDGVSVDPMRPNYTATTIDSVSYGVGQVWYTSYSNIQTALVAGNFTVPGGAIASVSTLYGRIILNAPIATNASVTCDVDYEFSTIQATGVQLNYLSCRSRQITNRWEAIRAAKAILAPNYVLGTKATSPDKIWGRYLNQEVTSHAKMELATSRDIEGDTDVYTRIVLYGRNISPTDLCMADDIAFDIPAGENIISTARWDPVTWIGQGAPSATPTLSYGRCEIQQGDAIQSTDTLERGVFHTKIRAGGVFAWRCGFIRAASLGSATPQGVYFEFNGIGTINDIIPSGETRSRIYMVCRDGAGETRRYATVSDPFTKRLIQRGERDVSLQIDWNGTRAIFYVDKRNTAEITTNLPDPTTHVVFHSANGVCSVGAVNAEDDTGEDVYDRFMTQDYVGRAFRHPLNYVESGEDYRRYATGIVGGGILPYPPPVFYVNGLPLSEGVHQVTDAPVTVLERAYTYDRNADQVGGGERIDTDYAYEIYFSHGSLSPMYAITIYDELGNVLFTIAANTPATVIVAIGWTLGVVYRVDYGRGMYYVHPHDVGMRSDNWDSEDIRHHRYYFEHRQTIAASTADYYVLYGDNILSIDYDEGLVDINEDLFANEVNPDQHPEDIAEGTFYYRETYRTMENAYELLDGNMNTHAQMAFQDPPMPGHHLFTLDLQSDQSIDAIDITGGFFVPPVGVNRQLHVDMMLSLYVSDDGTTFSLPCKEAYKFELSSGQEVTFGEEQIGQNFSARYLQLRLEGTECVTFGSPRGLWPVSIQQFRAWQGLILRGEASLVSDSADEDNSHLWDEDGLLNTVGDRVFKIRDANQFLGTQTHLDRVALGMLQEFYKNHTRVKANVAYGPHYEQGATIEVNDPTNKITNVNYYVEAISSSNGKRTLDLARYP